MLERIMAAIESAAASLKEIAIALKNAAVVGPATQTAASAPAPKPAAPKPAAPVEDDDLGLGPAAPAAPPAKVYTEEEVLKLARETAASKGRPAVKAALTAVGAGTTKDLKPENYAQFVAELGKAPAAA